MNSEEQIRFELDKSSGQNELSKSIVGISFFLLIGYGVVKTIQYLFRADEEFLDSIPPIIIKSGSFAIETDIPLKPDPAGQPAYRREGFGKIKAIRVIRYKEKKKKSQVDDFIETFDWDSTKGVQVNINLQNCQLAPNGDCVSWNAGSLINVFNSNNDFEVTTPINLSTSKAKLHPKRKAKREDEGVTQIFRFGSVEIRERIGGSLIKQYPAEDGWEYVIAFYNELSS